LINHDTFYDVNDDKSQKVKHAKKLMLPPKEKTAEQESLKQVA
jgi:hypothetical protein